MSIHVVQYKRMQSAMQRVTYKPGMRLRCMQDFGTGNIITMITGVAVDVTDQKKPVHLMRRIDYTPYQLEGLSDDDLIHYCVRQLIMDYEMHEMDEWFKVDSKCVREPHEQEFPRASCAR